MRHLKNRETNGGQIKEQDVPLTQDNSFMTVCDCHCLDGSLISYVWLPNSWQQQEKALEAVHSLKTYLRIILEVFSFSPQFHSLLMNQNPGGNMYLTSQHQCWSPFFNLYWTFMNHLIPDITLVYVLLRFHDNYVNPTLKSQVWSF